MTLSINITIKDYLLTGLCRYIQVSQPATKNKVTTNALVQCCISSKSGSSNSIAMRKLMRKSLCRYFPNFIIK